MFRTAQIDSNLLDNELYDILWSSVKENLDIANNKEEWELLLNTVIFLFVTKISNVGKVSTTYGSRLSGISFTSNRRSLYVVSVLSKYLYKKISHYFYSASAENSNLKSRLYRWIETVSNTFDLLNFLNYISAMKNSSKIYLTILHRVFDVKAMLNTSVPTFYENSINAGVEYQHRQLLWNAILELFNITLLSNNFLLMQARKTGGPTTNVIKNGKSVCPLCNEFPTNPYKILCCGKIYCYVCAVKSLEWKHCASCGSTSKLKAIALYD
ncbi:hypothetical protein KAFR_0C03720 [Kazachstania africana CBS 2517]|uniref:Pex N-terminal domain-containing protein n=1 Tax=Kazachstania africana (strain ATCC 22294 / BCRC 22015 / CBS 2517 / CECT 1963 / NBRC 1671 / NRRL Y-8276) TaxID=1071382 RepID=H2ASL4_KAZAF|nr:hypothetical protein KAFR_0C03720 [Kazachstania africana CBS 2517]CCF57364.1 hypothetical protein KAFR_0C03720 [Kazachstania africana CBS 2517]